MNGKTGLELSGLTFLKEIKVRSNLEILTEYQRWARVDEQSILRDAIMGVYQLDTSSEIVRM